MPIAPWETRRIQQLVLSQADLNTVVPDEHQPDPSARLETLELKTLELENVRIKSSNNLTLARAISAMTEVSI